MQAKNSKKVNGFLVAEIHGDLPSPGPTRCERVAPQAVFASVRADHVIGTPRDQEVDVDAPVGAREQRLPKREVVASLGVQARLATPLGSELGAPNAIEKVVSLNEDGCGVLQPSQYCLQNRVRNMPVGRRQGEHRRDVASPSRVLVGGEAHEQTVRVDEPPQNDQCLGRCAFRHRLGEGQDCVTRELFCVVGQ